MPRQDDVGTGRRGIGGGAAPEKRPAALAAAPVRTIRRSIWTLPCARRLSVCGKPEMCLYPTIRPSMPNCIGGHAPVDSVRARNLRRVSSSNTCMPLECLEASSRRDRNVFPESPPLDYRLRLARPPSG